MGQKINPIGLRTGIIRDWEAKWYAEKDFADLLHEDLKVREYIEKNLKDAAISKVEIERAANRVNIALHTGKPGMVIGKGGSEIDKLRTALTNLTGKKIHINVVEVKKVDMDAKLVAENIARQLENRVSFRRAQKQVLQRAMRAGAKGIKIMTSGRLSGIEIARSEKAQEGSVPCHTWRADIHYGFAEAFTTYGNIGVKVWVNKGILEPGEKSRPNIKAAAGRTEETAVLAA